MVVVVIGFRMANHGVAVEHVSGGIDVLHAVNQPVESLRLRDLGGEIDDGIVGLVGGAHLIGGVQPDLLVLSAALHLGLPDGRFVAAIGHGFELALDLILGGLQALGQHHGSQGQIDFAGLDALGANALDERGGILTGGL